MNEVVSNIPNVGIYLEVILGVILLIFFVLGLAKNWKFTLMEIVFFIGGVGLFKLIFNNVITSNPDIQNYLEENVAKSLIDMMKQINASISDVNSQNNINLPLIGGDLVSEEFYVGISYSLISAILTIAVAVVALIVSLILTAIIYNIINHFLLKNPTYKERKKKFWYKSIGLAPALIYGLMFVSVVVSPLYICRNSAIKSLDSVNSIDVNKEMEPIISKMNEYSNKIDEYGKTLDDVETKYYSIQEDVNEIEKEFNALGVRIEEIKSYQVKINDICENPGKLSSTDKMIAKEIKAKFDEYKSDIDTNYIDYQNTKKDVDSQIATYKDGKNQINEYRSKINEVKEQLKEVNLEEFDKVLEQTKKYEEQIKEYLPDLKVFGFLVIDFGFAKINYNDKEYDLSKNLDEVVNYLSNYISELCQDLYSALKPKFDEYDKMIEDTDKEIEETLKEVNKQLDSFSKDEYLKEIDEANTKLDEVCKETNFEEVKVKIDELDSKR